MWHKPRRSTSCAVMRRSLTLDIALEQRLADPCIRKFDTFGNSQSDETTAPSKFQITWFLLVHGVWTNGAKGLVPLTLRGDVGSLLP